MRSALVIVLLIVAAIAAYVLIAPFPGAPPAETSKPFDFSFSLVSTDGQTVSLKDFAGQVVIVDIWGTWCPPCRKGIPHFVALQDEYREEGLQIVGINYEYGTREEALASIEEFTAEIPINYPLLIGDESTQDQIPGFGAFPTTLFIDRAGKVHTTLVGLHSKEELEAIARELLEAPAPQKSPAPEADAQPQAAATELEAT